MSLSVYVNKKLTFPTEYSFSNVDPGGFEALNMTLPQGVISSPGEEVRVFEGSETVWHGRIEDPGRIVAHNVTTDQVNAVGYGVEHKDNTLQLIYVDSDINGFENPPLDERKALITSNFGLSESATDVAPVIGLPCLRTAFSDTWTAPTKPLSEAQYDAGYGNTVTEIIGDFSVSSTVSTIAGGAGFNYRWLFSTDNVYSSFDVLNASGASGTLTLSASTNNRRVIGVQFFHNTTPGGGAGSSYEVYATNVAIFGAHMLPVQTAIVAGTTVRGLALSDIIADVIKRSRTGFSSRIQYNPFIVRQAAYKTPTDFESIINDLAKFAGWHWGVWEPQGVASSTPTFYFSAPPPSADKVCFMSDCEEIDITKSYSAIHDNIIVEYTDALGKTKEATFFSPHPDLLAGDSHTLVLNMGVADDNAASAFARYALLLDQSTTRISGTTILPLKFRDGSPSHTLKAGRDKVRILNFPFAKTIIRGINSFRVSRVTVNVTNGVPRTTIEYDQGGDLIEVLQARLSQGNATIGF